MLLVKVWVIRTGLRMTLSSARRKPSPALNEGQRKQRSLQLTADRVMQISHPPGEAGITVEATI
jgi:hypothetical protein